ncbi:hypothetical protein BGZ92_008851 [Podila epicladia]|nr:hypothetical protein BGZ92_008851 [Podila epicladia]
MINPFLISLVVALPFLSAVATSPTVPASPIDMECDNHLNTSDCVRENAEYRIRVSMPIKGYLRVVNSLIEVVPSFQNATDPPSNPMMLVQ